MDDQRLGALARAVRRKLGWRQSDVGARAGVAQSVVSQFERGRLEELSLTTSRRICAALDIRLDLMPRWRGGEIDRLLDERHAAMVEAALILTSSWPGWQGRGEVTFAFYGDRGSIDVLAWNAALRAVLIEEIKSDLTAIEGTLRPLAIKRRWAADIAERELGWRPRWIGVVLVLPEGSHVRTRIARHQATFDSVLPSRSAGLRAWAREPNGPIGAIWFLSLSAAAAAKLRPAKRIRRGRPVRPRPSATADQK